MKLLFMDLDDDCKMKSILLNGVPAKDSEGWRNTISQTGTCYIIAKDAKLEGL